MSPGFGKERMHSALGCVEHTRERCEWGEHAAIAAGAGAAVAAAAAVLVPRAPRGSSGFESAVPSGGVGALPEGTAWG